MRFGVLGSLLAEIGGREVSINGLRQAKVLAALLVDANATVSLERLVDVVWDLRPPATAVRQIQDATSGIRRNLSACGAPAGLIETRRTGYRIHVDPLQLDLLAFDEHRQAARNTRHAADAAAALRRALACWRGPALADLAGRALEDEAARLNGARTAVHKECLDIELALGRHLDLVAELTALLLEQPLDEQVAEHAMLALYRSGRRSEALQIFQDTRLRLAEDLGIDPGPSLQHIHSRILKDDPSLAAPRGGSAPAATALARTRWIPRQLPADTRAFTGRTAEVNALVELARRSPEGSSAGLPMLATITGMGGIGKSALAIRVAHQISALFPDGQLFVDLRGYTAGLDPLSAQEALDYLLRSLDVPPQRIPQDLGERAAFYRAQLAGTRTLVVLDNASSSAQVQPLIPGSAGCMVMVTSRKDLTGLDDAPNVTLDVLPEDDALALLRTIAGADRIPAGEPSAYELVKLAGQLPLAIRIAAARLRHRRALSVEGLTEQLRDEAGRLEHLNDEGRDVTSVLAASYADLLAAEQRLFRLLGLIPGPDLDAYAAAHLLDASHHTAERTLELLQNFNLLLQQTPGRYRMHDLIRTYSRRLSRQEPPSEQKAATARLFDYYQYSARHAERQLARYTYSGAPALVPVPDPAPAISDVDRARAWLRVERANLHAALDHTDEPARRIALTAALAPLMELEGPRSQESTLHRAAASAAHEYGLPLEEANALWRLGRVERLAGHFEAAAELLGQAQAIYRRLDDRQGEANATWELGLHAYQVGGAAAALDLYERALAAYQDLDDRRGEANALRDAARAQVMLGNYHHAVHQLERAIARYRELGDRSGEANALSDLAHLRFQLGELQDGSELLERALTIARSLGDRQAEANTLWLSGRMRLAQGRHLEAAEVLERGLVLCQELGTRHGEASTLSALGQARLAQGDLEAARELQERALAIFRAVGEPHGEANVLHALARVLHGAAEHENADRHLRQALATFRAAGDLQGEAEALNSLGALVAETAGPGEALALYRRSLEIARMVPIPLDEARALEGAARCQVGSDRSAAIADLRRAVALYHRTGAAEARQAADYLAGLEASGA